MLIYDRILTFLGNTLGADPSTLTTASKTVVGAINEVATSIETEHNRIHISTVEPTDADGSNGDIWLIY